MKTLLQINTSIFSNAGESSRLADEFVANWRAQQPDAIVTTRDLARDPVPHLTAERFQAFLTKPDERSTEQLAVVAYSDALIDELKRADVIVLGLPMYNFGVSSTLKAYFDHVARAGVSFRYTEKGPVGMLGADKKAYMFATRGGFYAGTAHDTQTNHVRDFLRLIGIDDVEFVYAEGLGIGPEQKQVGLTQAKKAIARLTMIDVSAAA